MSVSGHRAAKMRQLRVPYGRGGTRIIGFRNRPFEAPRPAIAHDDRPLTHPGCIRVQPRNRALMSLLTIIRTSVDACMSEPPKSQRPLPELAAFFGAPDAVEPINTHLFGRK